MSFIDREDAAKQLAKALSDYQKRGNVVIVGIPRGGVEIGYFLATALSAPLSFSLTKKIGHPYSPEFAIGVASLDEYYLDEQLMQEETIDETYLKEHIQKIQSDLKEKQSKLSSLCSFDFKNKTLIICDDGIATGKTLLLTLKILRKKDPQKMVIAIPVASKTGLQLLEKEADETVCLETPPDFHAVGQFYESFESVSDEKMQEYLEKANAH